MSQVPSRRLRSCSPKRSPPRRDYVVPTPGQNAPPPASQLFTRPGAAGSSLPHTTNLSLRSPYKSAGMFNQARDFTVTGTIVDSSITYNSAPSSQFMRELLEETIRGAEFDSSDRDPPPRCHPGTRLAILGRCLYFVSNCNGAKKMRWVVGGAGVGKSAIMQSVAESPELVVSFTASVFFSINGRDNGTRAIITISYQLAAKSVSYRQVIEEEITRDPSLLRSSMAKQFKKLIVEPFVHDPKLKSAGRVLIIIDGLDECKDHRSQQELLRLISDLCLEHPSSPLVWLIASRPEPQITSVFSRSSVIPAYEKEEIPVDCDEARADVERFLREELTKIKEESDSLDPLWPEEPDFWKLASAAGGLFAYAQTVVKYIGDSMIGSPVSQLSDVLHIIDEHPMTDVSREEHPMALLDVLYERILSNVPHKIMPNTRKLLLALASGWNLGQGSIHIARNFVVLCNWLGMTADEGYAALNHLRSILYVPRRHQPHKGKLEAFHKSFIDYISDYTRSKFSPDIRDEARQLAAKCTFRILNKVPHGIELNILECGYDYGRLASGPMTRDGISLSWSVGDASGWDNSKTRLSMYHLALDEVVKGMIHGDSIFQSDFCVRFLTTVFESYSARFPRDKLLNAVFDNSRRPETMKRSILKRIPLSAVSAYGISSSAAIKLQFRRTTITNLSDTWNPSCPHEREGKWEAGGVYDWTTTFRGTGFHESIVFDCEFCFSRLEYQLENWGRHSSDDTALVLFTSTGDSCVQLRLVDPKGNTAEWIYSFWCFIPRETREKYGSSG